MCFADAQVVEEAQQPLSEYYRHLSKGAWPFSTRDHGWPISDCSSEGLKAALILSQLPHEKVRLTREPQGTMRREGGKGMAGCLSLPASLRVQVHLTPLCHLQVGNPVPDERLADCVNVILSYQNFDGGMATYENTRSFHCLEVCWGLLGPVGALPPGRLRPSAAAYASQP